jgi:phage N-6-adenine-methyltransferase
MAGYKQTAKRTDWRTPKHIIAAVESYFCSDIELDPCASDDPKNWIALKNLNLAEGHDGLTADWEYKTVYCNPPYGRGINKWVEKASKHNGPTIMLIPAAVDTRWWQDTIFPNAQVCFVRGRIKFELDGVKATAAPMACAIIGFNVSPIEFKQAFGHLGTCR